MVKARPNLKNFFYLLGSGLLIHFMGTVYRIWLARKIGAEGLGIFQMAYPVYRLLSSLASLGLPMALTKWVAEYQSCGDLGSILTLRCWAVRNTFICSVIAGILLLISAPALSSFIFSEPRVCPAFMILALAIPFSALSSVYRGYFQGFSLMAPTALSEITEQTAEIGLTCLGLILLIAVCPVPGYIYPIIGLTAGEIVCLSTLFIYLHHPVPSINVPFEAAPIPRIEILNYAWPLLLNQIVGAVSMASEAAIIPRLLMNIYNSSAEGTRWFGILNGMASPIAFFPLIFLAPLATVLSPQVSAALKNKGIASIQPKIRRFYAITLISSIGGSILIFSHASYLSDVLYNSFQPVLLIRILSLGLPFTSIAILNLTILSAVGLSNKILWISLWAITLKTALFFILINILGIHGAAWTITFIQLTIFLTSFIPAWPYLTRCPAEIFPKLPQPFRFLKGRH